MKIPKIVVPSELDAFDLEEIIPINKIKNIKIPVNCTKVTPIKGIEKLWKVFIIGLITIIKSKALKKILFELSIFLCFWLRENN